MRLTDVQFKKTQVIFSAQHGKNRDYNLLILFICMYMLIFLCLKTFNWHIFSFIQKDHKNQLLSTFLGKRNHYLAMLIFGKTFSDDFGPKKS